MYQVKNFKFYINVYLDYLIYLNYLVYFDYIIIIKINKFKQNLNFKFYFDLKRFMIDAICK